VQIHVCNCLCVRRFVVCVYARNISLSLALSLYTRMVHQGQHKHNVCVCRCARERMCDVMWEGVCVCAHLALMRARSLSLCEAQQDEYN